jgi:hypothetical protein
MLAIIASGSESQASCTAPTKRLGPRAEPVAAGDGGEGAARINSMLAVGQIIVQYCRVK